MHLKSSQFFDGLFGKGVSLKAENLADLHGSALERLQFLANPPRSFLLKTLLSFRPLLFAKPKILGLIAEVASGQGQAQLSETEAAGKRARLNDFLHQSQPPFFSR